MAKTLGIAFQHRLRHLLPCLSRIAVWVILTLGVVWLSKVSGPLTVHSTNSRYFADSSGNAVYLSGAYFNDGSDSSDDASAWFTILPGQPVQLKLTWQDNSTNENGFQIERKLGPNGTYVRIASVAANTTSYLDTKLANGTTYCYRVRAFNASQTSDYTNDTCMTTVP
jgi:hypothetical protein